MCGREAAAAPRVLLGREGCGPGCPGRASVEPDPELMRGLGAVAVSCPRLEPSLAGRRWRPGREGLCGNSPVGGGGRAVPAHEARGKGGKEGGSSPAGARPRWALCGGDRPVRPGWRPAPRGVGLREGARISAFLINSAYLNLREGKLLKFSRTLSGSESNMHFT